jgi:phage terminase small subunit
MVAAYANGSRLLGNDNIKIVIAQLKQNKLNQAMLNPEDIFQKYMDIAFADITDYVSFGMYGDSGYVKVNDSKSIDGSIVTEISESQNGIKIKLADKMKALQWLSEHMDMATTEQKARIEHLKEKDKLDRQRFEHQKEMDERSNF